MFVVVCVLVMHILVHIRRLWRRFGAHSSSVAHISVLKRLFGAHFGAKKALWCTFWG